MLQLYSQRVMHAHFKVASRTLCSDMMQLDTGHRNGSQFSIIDIVVLPTQRMPSLGNYNCMVQASSLGSRITLRSPRL